MEQAISKTSLKSKSLQVPYLILKFLSHDNQVFLEATEFAFSRAEVRRCIRGTNSVVTNVGTFRWNQAVRAVCILALRYFIYRESDRAEDRSLVGGAGSLAASLDYSIAKNTGWLSDVFGSDSNGTLVVRKLITRQNPERKRPGPVVVAFTKNIQDMGFFLNGEELVDQEALLKLLNLLGPSEGIVKATVPIDGKSSRSLEVCLGGPASDLPKDVSLSSACPYKGLLPFKGSDASIYFGRENETEHLMETILRVPFVVVFGPSGIGKSSLISAGLIPLLTSDCSVGSVVGSGWRSITFRPLGDPTQAMVVNLLGSVSAENGDVVKQQDVEAVSEALKKGDAGPLLTALRRSWRGSRNLLIFVDQFEELYTACSEEYRKAFYQAVHALIEADPLCRFVCALRADFFSDFLSSGLGHYLERGTFPLLPMRRDQVKRAIELPALKMGRRFEQGLVDTILADAAEEPGALPLVQFVLERLWEDCRAQQSDITKSSYSSLGRLSGALAAHADNVLAGLSPRERTKARNLFGRLVRVAVDQEDVRDSRVSLKLTPELSTDFGKIIETLTDARLLVVSREPSSQASSIDLSHETIIQHWVTLRTWIAEDRHFLSWRSRISPLIAELGGGEGNVEESFLLRGKALEEAKFWVEHAGERLSGLETRFIQSSISAHSFEVKERRRVEMESSVAALRSVNFGDLKDALKALHVAYPEALECLTQTSEIERNEEARLRLYIARLAYCDRSRSVVSYIQQRALTLPVESFLAVVDILRPHRKAFSSGLWKALNDKQLSEAQFLRAAALLSEFDHTSSQWKTLVHLLVRYISREPPTVIVPLGPLFRPIREHMLEPLVQLCTNETEGEARRSSAALLLAILGQEDVPLMARLACLADAGQYAIFFETLNGTPQAIEEAKEWWYRRLYSVPTMTQKELAGTVFNLCKSGLAASGIPALFSVPSNLSPLSEFVGLCVTHGLECERIWSALEDCSDPRTVYVLLLALGSSARPPENWIEERLPYLIEIYRDNPHAGIHSALRWLFNIWGRGEIRTKIDLELAMHDVNWSRGWFTVNIRGLPCTFVTFEMLEGSTKKRFAMAVAPTTREEFIHFRSDSEIRKYGQYHPDPSCPVVGVSWFDALEYCRWMQDNAPATLGLEIRLPRDDEWEFACRQGTTTDFFFGHNFQHFQFFGWYYANAVTSTRPVGTLRPSPWGLFDMHGNVWEWIMDEYTQEGVKLIDSNDGVEIGNGDSRLLRGGAWCDSPTWCRATERSNPHWPTDRNLMFGFRISCVEKHVAS